MFENKNNSRFLSNLQIIVKEVDIVINSELLSFFFNLFISRVRLIKKKLNYNSIIHDAFEKLLSEKKNQIRLLLMFSYETNQQHNNVHESLEI